jgi:hypothetical protein
MVPRAIVRLLHENNRFMAVAIGNVLIVKCLGHGIWRVGMAMTWGSGRGMSSMDAVSYALEFRTSLWSHVQEASDGLK